MWDFVPIACGYAVHDPVLLTTLTQLEAAGVFAGSTPASMALAGMVSPPSTASPADRDELLQLMTTRPAENIEDALVKASTMKQTLKTGLLPLRFNFAISRLFQTVGWNVRLDLLRKFLEQERLDRAQGTFVTFNYDLLLEHTLEGMGIWAAADGYGAPFTEYVEIATTDRHMAHLRKGKGGAVGTVKSHRITAPAKASAVTILKPHGSLNWLCQFTGNYGFVGSPTHLALTAEQKLGYLATYNIELLERPNAHPWPQAGIFISAPTLKNPIPAVIDLEVDALIAADDVYVIGWSLPPTDAYQLRLIASAIAQRRRPFRRVVVIDRNPAHHHYERIRAIFSPACAFEPWPHGFEHYVSRSVVRRAFDAVKRGAASMRCAVGRLIGS